MRILLVDDDVALMDILAERLIKQRYVVDIAAGRPAQRGATDRRVIAGT